MQKKKLFLLFIYLGITNYTLSMNVDDSKNLYTKTVKQTIMDKLKTPLKNNANVLEPGQNADVTFNIDDEEFIISYSSLIYSENADDFFKEFNNFLKILDQHSSESEFDKIIFQNFFIPIKNLLRELKEEHKDILFKLSTENEFNQITQLLNEANNEFHSGFNNRLKSPQAVVNQKLIEDACFSSDESEDEHDLGDFEGDIEWDIELSSRTKDFIIGFEKLFRKILHFEKIEKLLNDEGEVIESELFMELYNNVNTSFNESPEKFFEHFDKLLEFLNRLATIPYLMKIYDAACDIITHKLSITQPRIKNKIFIKSEFLDHKLADKLILADIMSANINWIEKLELLIKSFEPYLCNYISRTTQYFKKIVTAHDEAKSPSCFKNCNETTSCIENFKVIKIFNDYCVKFDNKFYNFIDRRIYEQLEKFSGNLKIYMFKFSMEKNLYNLAAYLTKFNVPVSKEIDSPRIMSELILQEEHQPLLAYMIFRGLNDDNAYLHTPWELQEKFKAKYKEICLIEPEKYKKFISQANEGVFHKPLTLLILQNSLDYLVKGFVNSGSDISIKDKFGNSAVTIASDLDQWKHVNILLSSVTAKPDDINYACKMLLSKENFNLKKLKKFLINFPFKVSLDCEDKNQKYLLHRVLKTVNPINFGDARKCMKLLTNSGTKDDIFDEGQETPLTLAAKISSSKDKNLSAFFCHYLLKNGYTRGKIRAIAIAQENSYIKEQIEGIVFEKENVELNDLFATWPSVNSLYYITKRCINEQRRNGFMRKKLPARY